MGEKRITYKCSVGKPEGRRQVGRRRRRWEDNDKTYLKEIGTETVDWVPAA
jgi:hypothetical protein